MSTTTAPSNNRLAARLPERIFQADHFDDIPTTLFEIREFLASDVFGALAESFPGSDTHYRTHERGKKSIFQILSRLFGMSLRLLRFGDSSTTSSTRRMWSDNWRSLLLLTCSTASRRNKSHGDSPSRGGVGPTSLVDLRALCTPRNLRDVFVAPGRKFLLPHP